MSGPSGGALTMDEMQQTFAERLASALEKLRGGVLEEAHQMLIRLVRHHGHDAAVVFNLGLARKRLGYDVSAEALLAQALERGYKLDEASMLDLEGQPKLRQWRDPASGVSFVVTRRARRREWEFVGFEPPPLKNAAAPAMPPAAAVASLAETTSDEPTPGPEAEPKPQA